MAKIVRTLVLPAALSALLSLMLIAVQTQPCGGAIMCE